MREFLREEFALPKRRRKKFYCAAGVQVRSVRKERADPSFPLPVQILTMIRSLWGLLWESALLSSALS
jgi:hypothetical protein